MRVIAGSLRGRHLATPTWSGLRPTSDKLRETLFNIVAPRVAGARVVDGYSGTGAIGIEAVSRGATHVTFIDVDKRAVALIRKNIAACRIESGVTVERGDVAAILAGLPADALFDLIVLDPPYEAKGIVDALEAAARRLAPGGLLVLEHAARRPPDNAPSLIQMRTVKSGDSVLTLFERRN